MTMAGDGAAFAAGVNLTHFQHPGLEVCMVAGAGRGVRAVESIEAGAVLLVESAVVVGTDAALPKAAARVLSTRGLPSLERSQRLVRRRPAASRIQHRKPNPNISTFL